MLKSTWFPAGMQNTSPDTLKRKERRGWLCQRPKGALPIPAHRETFTRRQSGALGGTATTRSRQDPWSRPPVPANWVTSARRWNGVFGPNGDNEIATRLAAASTQFFLELSLLIECLIWAERAIAHLGDQHKNSRREMEIYASLSLPALFRMKGLILASRSAEDHFEAEESLLSATDWAKHQHASLFEWKAATDLAELLQIQGRVSEARQHLGAAFDRMPAEIVSPTYKRALQILDDLQPGIRAVG
jgi:predicted ATPase